MRHLRRIGAIWRAALEVEKSAEKKKLSGG